MATRPWMKLYVGDMIADTMHLDPFEFTIYMRLLMHYWQKGCLKTCSKQCSSIAQAYAPEMQQALQNVLNEFFTHQGEYYVNTRMEKELACIEKTEIAAESNSLKAKKAAEARWNKKNKDKIDDAPSNAPSIAPSNVEVRSYINKDINTNTPISPLSEKDELNKKTVTKDKRQVERRALINLPNWMTRENWDLWKLHRKNIKKPFSTENAENLSLKTLIEFKESGYDPIAIMNYSIENGYPGFYEPKNKGVVVNLNPAKQNQNKSYQEKNSEMIHKMYPGLKDAVKRADMENIGNLLNDDKGVYDAEYKID